MAFSGIRFMKWTYDRIKKRDLFKKSVSLTFKGEDSFVSCIGGFVSIIIFVIIIGVGALLGLRMIRRQEISWNYNTVIRELRSETVPVNLTSQDEIILKVDVVYI